MTRKDTEGILSNEKASFSMVCALYVCVCAQNISGRIEKKPWRAVIPLESATVCVEGKEAFFLFSLLLEVLTVTAIPGNTS